MIMKVLAAKLGLAAITLSGIVHSGPCTLQNLVHVPRHGTGYETVQVSGKALDCRGPVRDVWVSAYSADGGEESEPARWGHGHWTAKLRFTAADAPSTWYIGGVTGSCRDGSIVQYWGRHPSFKVER